MYKKFNTIVKIVNIVISFYIKTSNENSNENSKKSVFLFFYHPQHKPPQYQQIPQRKY